MNIFKVILICCFGLKASLMFCHPNGNIIVTENNCVLWPYVAPVGDIGHHASIMLWDQETEPRMFLKSDYESSDYFLYTKGKNIYIIENRYINSKDIFESRILKTSINLEEPNIIWDWFEDEMYIGVGGFKMLNDTKLIFINYPNIYSLNKDETPFLYFKFDTALNKMKPVENNNLLIWGENSAWLTDEKGNILKHWDGLIEELKGNSPLDRNVIFDMDYTDGSLLMAYWGKRTFELIDQNNVRTVIHKIEPEWVPHWVAFFNGKPLLFSSFLDFENSFTPNGKSSTIQPYFIMLSNAKHKTIWEK